jgi:hypothetical protein
MGYAIVMGEASDRAIEEHKAAKQRKLTRDDEPQLRNRKLL